MPKLLIILLSFLSIAVIAQTDLKQKTSLSDASKQRQEQALMWLSSNKDKLEKLGINLSNKHL